MGVFSGVVKLFGCWAKTQDMNRQQAIYHVLLMLNTFTWSRSRSSYTLDHDAAKKVDFDMLRKAAECLGIDLLGCFDTANIIRLAKDTYVNGYQTQRYPSLVQIDIAAYRLQESIKYQDGLKDIETKFYSLVVRREMLKNTRIAKSSEYHEWLQKYISGGGRPTAKSDCKFPSIYDIRTLTKPITVYPLSSMVAIKMILPPGIAVPTGDLGGNTIYHLADGTLSGCESVCVYKDSIN